MTEICIDQAYRGVVVDTVHTSLEKFVARYHPCVQQLGGEKRVTQLIHTQGFVLFLDDETGYEIKITKKAIH